MTTWLETKGHPRASSLGSARALTTTPPPGSLQVAPKHFLPFLSPVRPLLEPGEGRREGPWPAARSAPILVPMQTLPAHQGPGPPPGHGLFGPLPCSGQLRQDRTFRAAERPGCCPGWKGWLPLRGETDSRPEEVGEECCPQAVSHGRVTWSPGVFTCTGTCGLRDPHLLSAFCSVRRLQPTHQLERHPQLPSTCTAVGCPQAGRSVVWRLPEGSPEVRLLSALHRAFYTQEHAHAVIHTYPTASPAAQKGPLSPKHLLHFANLYVEGGTVHSPAASPGVGGRGSIQAPDWHSRHQESRL